ncbi:MAG: iron-sulfur cluster assembly scaffold protein [Deltaproteobacteria bacterium]|nr:MAG: iron-sulfur cluster assembly scaffold protein [Deltaproteobacteria bacterium]
MEKDFDFWQEHSMQYLEMAFRTDRRERVADPDGYGKRTGTCGDSVEIFLKVKNEKIQAVSYEIDGCLNTNACANTVADMATGKTVEEAWEITPEKVVEYLGTLPAAEIHCAEVAAGAFYRALTNYQEHSAIHDLVHAAGNHETQPDRVTPENNQTGGP